MPRSPLTLAASVSAALPRTSVVGVRELTERAGGRFETVLVTLDDGRHVVGRLATTEESTTELVDGVRALGALTTGVRALLPFDAPVLLGQATVDGERFVVVDHLPGTRVDAAEIPGGRGIASALGSAIAAVHGLPTSVIRNEGLPVRTPDQLREDAARLLDRVDGTGRAPGELVARWRRAVSSDELWRFESTVTLGGVATDAFVFGTAAFDHDGPEHDAPLAEVPRITALLDWHGLSVGDPAIDLRWTSAAPIAADAAFDAYADASARAADPALRQRARLHAELEFAQWLVHGFDTGRTEVVDDAAALLTSLADGVRGEDILAAGTGDIDDALTLLDQTPVAPDIAAIDTSMQTDAYDPRLLAAYLDDPDDADAGPEQATAPTDPNATAPLDLGAFDADPDHPDTDPDHRDAERAALQRWARPDSD